MVGIPTEAKVSSSLQTVQTDCRPIWLRKWVLGFIFEGEMAGA